MPTIETTMSFPRIYLEDFDENICNEYYRKSIENFEFHRDKYIENKQNVE